MRNVNMFKIKYIIALFRWYFKVSKYIKPNKTNISLSRRMGSLWRNSKYEECWQAVYSLPHGTQANNHYAFFV